jgi:hypothetical protein
MAKTENSFPTVVEKNWWALRIKFKQSIPGVVTYGYLATVLNITEASARTNVFPWLRSMGLIDDDSKPTNLATRWRDDDSYADVCQEIVTKTYPRELIDAIDDLSHNYAAVKKWFANKMGVGDSSAQKLATTYVLLSEGNPSKSSVASKKVVQAPKQKPRASRNQKPEHKAVTDVAPSTHVKAPVAEGPGVSINLQIHISADSSPEQIDQIFAGMAKHIYQRG